MAAEAEEQEYELTDESDEVLPVEELVVGGPEEDVEPEPPPLIVDDDDPNLASTFDKHREGQDWVRDFVSDVIEKFDQDYAAGEEMREKRAKDWKLFCCELPKKDIPFDKCANVNVPISAENMTRIVFHVWSELFVGVDQIITVNPLGPNDEQAKLMTIHDNWQITEQMSDFMPNQFRGLLGFFHCGDSFCHSYYDELARTNRHMMLSPDEFIMPYVHTSVAPDLSDLPHYTRIIHHYGHELKRKELWHNVDQVLKRKPSWDDDPLMQMREAVAEVWGEEPEPEAMSAAYKLYWHEGWYMLPNQTRERFVRAIIDPISKTLLSLIIQEEHHWQDRVRYEQQMLELEQYRMSEMQYLNDRDEHQNMMAAAQALPILGPMLGPPPQAPPPPAWMNDPSDPEELPEPGDKVPRLLFSHGICIDNLTGPHGLSFGGILGDLNRSANAVLNQFIDAGTLHNAPGFLQTDEGELKTPLRMAPGVVHKMSGAAGKSLRDMIMPLQTGAPSPAMREVVEMLVRFGQTSTQANDVLSGAEGKSGEAFRGLATRLEQATKVLSVAGYKYRLFFRQVIKNNAALNAVHLKDDQILRVTQGEQPVQIRVGRHMWQRDYQVTINADLTFKSKADRVAEADQTMMMVLQHPQLAGNLAIQHQALVNSFKARGASDLVRLLGPQPPPAPFGMPPPMPPGAPGTPPGQGPPPQQRPPQEGS